MPPNFPFVAGGYAAALKQLGHVDFLICCPPLNHCLTEPGACSMCRRILTGTETVEFVPEVPFEVYAFDPLPASTHHFSASRDPHLVAACTAECQRHWEFVATPGRIAPRLPALTGKEIMT